MVVLLRDQNKLAHRLKGTLLKSNELAAVLRNSEKLAKEIEATAASSQHKTITDLVSRVLMCHQPASE